MRSGLETGKSICPLGLRDTVYLIAYMHILYNSRKGYKHSPSFWLYYSTVLKDTFEKGMGWGVGGWEGGIYQ